MTVKVLGSAAVVVDLSLALFASPVSNVLFTTSVHALDADSTLLAPYLNLVTEGNFTGYSNANLARVVLNNMLGADHSNSAALLQTVTDLFGANPHNRGVIVYELGQALSGLEGDATYGAAALAWNNAVFDSYTQSSTPGFAPAYKDGLVPVAATVAVELVGLHAL